MSKKEKIELIKLDQNKEEEEKIELIESDQHDEEFFELMKEDLIYMAKNNQMLKDNKELFHNDPHLILYRLPLTEKQREELYNRIIENNNIEQ